MDHRRAAADLRACVRDVGEWFAAAGSSARRLRLLSRMQAANELAVLVRELDRQGRLGEHIELLLSLVPGVRDVAAAAVNTSRQDQCALVFAGTWQPLLAAALLVCCTLITDVAPRVAQAEQLAPLVPVVVAMVHAALHLCRQLMRLPQEQPAAFVEEPCRWQLAANLDDCMRLQLRLLLDCFEAAGGDDEEEEGPPRDLAALLQGALPPSRVHTCLQGAVDVVEWVLNNDSGKGGGGAACLPALFHLLGGAPEELLCALCHDVPLLGRLARLTARVHAAQVAAASWQDPAWFKLHCSFLRWSGCWCFLPLNECQQAAQQAALLPLLVAGGSMLKGEVSLLASLPVQAPAGSAAQAKSLIICWLYCINITGRYLCLSMNGPFGAASQPSTSRLYQLLQLAGQSGQQVARFVHALTAAAPDGPPARQAAFASWLATSCPFTVGEALRSWASWGGFLSQNCRAAGPAGTAAQQQEAAAAAAQLLGAQLGLLQMLAPLAPSLEANAFDASPAGPAAGGDAGSHSSGSGSDADSGSSGGGSPSGSCQAPDTALLVEFNINCLELVYAASETACLLAHRVLSRAAAPPGPPLLQRLHTSACHAVHGLLALCPEALEPSMLHPAAWHQGVMDADAAAKLTGLLLDLSMALQSALLRALPAADAEPGAAADWDRAYARCLLELTAAVAALQPHTLGCKRKRSTKWLRPNTARQRAVAALQQLTTHRFARRYGLCCADDAPTPTYPAASTIADPPASSSGSGSSSPGAPGSQLSEQGVLAALAGRLIDPASRELLPPLLARLLPPADDACQQAAPSPVPTAAAVFQAQALAQRPCAHLLCSNLAGSSDDLPITLRGKRCGGCRLVRYCSQACSVAAWPAHKPACRALAGAVTGRSTQQ